MFLLYIGISWRQCQWTAKSPTEQAKIAESEAVDPQKLKVSASRCRKYSSYVLRWSKSTVSDVCERFGISNLTSASLQYKFMCCTGQQLYKYFADNEGNLHVPKPFHSCKKMSFRDSGVPTLLVSYPGSGNSWVRQVLESSTGIYTGSDRDCDVDYIKAGMLGEGISSENVIAVKFHLGPLPKRPFKKVIYIIRNPYDAAIADYQRHCAALNERVNISGNPHVSKLSMDKFGEYTNVKVGNLIF